MKILKSDPKNLVNLQSWFGEWIIHPLPEKYRDNPLAVSTPQLAEEADSLLRENGGMSGFARLGVYNQQYWFRLITILQGEYPCAVHLIGLRTFNQWVIRYLVKNPPASPYLAELDARFLAFMSESYQEKNREEVLQSIELDRAFSRAFDAAEGISISAGGQSAEAILMTARFQLAPHVTPLQLAWQFLEFRPQCLRDESLELSIELKPGAVDLVIFRDEDHDILSLTILPLAMRILKEFRNPISLSQAFENLENELSSEEFMEIAAGISGWFQNWVARKWLCLAEVQDLPK